jgi:hypothetical protein
MKRFIKSFSRTLADTISEVWSVLPDIVFIAIGLFLICITIKFVQSWF